MPGGEDQMRGFGTFPARKRLAKVPPADAYAQRFRSLLELIDIRDGHEARFAALIAKRTDARSPHSATECSTSRPASPARPAKHGYASTRPGAGHKPSPPPGTASEPPFPGS